MGFEINLLLLLPEEMSIKHLRYSAKDSEKYILWKVQTVLNIGRVSAPASKKDLIDFPSKGLAALYFTECIWQELNTNIEERGKECFAPPFSILKAMQGDDSVTHCRWRNKARDFIKAGDEFIRPLSSGSLVSRQIPSQYSMEKHNESLGDSSKQNSLEHFVRSYPLYWFQCGEVLKWIENKQEKILLDFPQENKAALAILSMCKHCLREMDSVGGKCLFIFEDVNSTIVAF